METRGRFTLLSLSEFQEYLTNNSFNRVIRVIQNHHTFIPNYSHFTGQNHFKLLAGMEGAHLERGFAEIAQNLTIFPDGTVALCRSLDRIPAGIFGANIHGICIENIGDFDVGRDQMEQPQREAILFVNALLCLKFKLVPDLNTVVYHHWYDLQTGQRTNGSGITKSCPGGAFFGGNDTVNAQTSFLPLIDSTMQNIVFSPPSVIENETQKQGIVNVTTILFVRQGPGREFKKIKHLNNGTTIAIFEIKKGWYRVDPDDQWVYSKHVKLIESP